MRETNLDKPIARQDIKVGDKIVVSHEVVVKAVRETDLYAGFGKERKPVTIVTADRDTIAITNDERVRLLERDKVILEIPVSATIISWKDDDGYDHYARRNEASGEWTTSQNGPKTTYTTAALIEAIEHDEFDGYTEGSFEILKRHSPLASGGVLPGVSLGRNSIEALTRLAQPMNLGSSPITGYPIVP